MQHGAVARQNLRRYISRTNDGHDCPWVDTGSSRSQRTESHAPEEIVVDGKAILGKMNTEQRLWLAWRAPRTRGTFDAIPRTNAANPADLFPSFQPLRTV